MTTKISTNDDYVVTHTNIREGANITLSHTENPTTTIVGLSPIFSKRMDNVELDLNTTKDVLSSKQDKLSPYYGVSIENNLITGHFATRVASGYDLNNLRNGAVRGDNMVNAPTSDWYFIESYNEGNYTTQRAYKLLLSGNDTVVFMRYRQRDEWSQWVEQLTDVKILNNYAQKSEIPQSYSATAPQGSYIDLSNYTLPSTITTVDTWYGKAITKHPILDVVFEAVDTTGVTHQYESRALYKVSNNTIEINTTTITSNLLAENLGKVLSFTTL